MRSRTFFVTSTLLLILVLMVPALVAQEEEPTVEPFPNVNQRQIVSAEQVFENGRMLYLQPAQRIWVLVYGEDTLSGTWTPYADTWTEDMPEFDPAIRPPDGLHQPIRGFGHVWRENAEVRNALGWALDPEFGYETTYEYLPGEIEVDGDDVGVQPGFHKLGSYYGGVYTFDEMEGTWVREDAPEITNLDEMMAPEATPEVED